MDYIKVRQQKQEKKISRYLQELKQYPKSHKTIKSYIDDRLYKHSNATAISYLYQIKQFMAYLGKDFNIKKVTCENIKGYLGKLRQANINLKLAYSSIMDLCRYIEGLDRKEIPTVFKKIDSVKRTTKETEPLDFDKEVKPLITAMSDSIRNQALIFVLYETMLRKVELLSLRVCDIDMDKKPAPVTVRISKTDKGKNRPTFIYNSIPLVKDWLNEHPLRGKNNFNTSPLFVTRTGDALTESTIRTILYEASIRAFGSTKKKDRNGKTIRYPKKRIYPHLFRHSRAYELATVYHYSPQELMKSGGWSNSTMLDTYYNPKSSDIRNKLLNGHGIITVTQKQRERALKERQIRLCGCGEENSYDKIFCTKCGTILNIKAYNKQIKSKDTEIDDLKKQVARITAIVEAIADDRKIKGLRLSSN